MPVATAQVPVATVQAGQPQVLNFSNWIDYIPKDIIQAFEQKTNIKVRYRTYRSNEELQTRVEGDTDIDDLVVPGLGFAKAQLDKGLYQPLDKRLLPNYQNLDPELLKAMERVDVGNRHFLPWGWGFTTLFINRTQVMRDLAGGAAKPGKAALPPLPFPGNEWDLVFNPTYSQRLKGCGIAMLESPSEILPLALKYIGKDPYSQQPSDYRLATEMLRKVRPDIRKFTTSVIDTLSTGNYCVAVGWSGDIQSAITALRETRPKEVFQGLLPSSGSSRFIDVLAIPKNARNPANAHAFINFYMDAVQAAQMPNEVGYPNGNLAAMRYVDSEVQKLPLVFPPPTFRQKLVGPESYSTNARWAMVQSFMAFAFRLDIYAR
jgi:putrescine transport system substrate-binding protein